MPEDALEIAFDDKGKEIVVRIGGRLDTATAPRFQKETVDRCAGRSVTVDMTSLKYISSAGLRALMVLRKACPSVSLENASGLVEEVLDVSDFRKLMG